MKNPLILLSVCLLAACGGGSGESGSTPTSAPQTTSTQSDSTNEASSQSSTTQTEAGQEQEAEAAKNEGMASLQVDSAFDLTTDFNLSIVVEEGVVSQRAFINICREDTLLANDDNCFLRAPLNESGLTNSVTIPHTGVVLKAEIWLYNPDSEPTTYKWQFDSSSAEQTWTIQ